ncbi:putative SEC22-synaptobrevin [Ramicandelaber brevisporus]|nr:putative SEC22-synaptobrevin [Ramicandelaber brevisporus]
MVRSTIIARASDGLPLAASMDDEAEASLSDYKRQAKLIFKKLTPNSEPVCSVESGPFTLHYLVRGSVCYLVICERAFPRKTAFSYLEELSREFQLAYGAEVDRPGLRPYAFIKFDTFMQKTKRVYQNAQSSADLNKISEELSDVSRIVTKNMEDLLWRGDSLDKMSSLSDDLRTQARKYRTDARDLNLQAMYRKYGIPAFFVLVFILVIYIWRYVL